MITLSFFLRQGLEVVSWLPPVIISAIVSFVALFIVRYNMQSDQGVKTATSSKILEDDVKEIKVITNDTNRVVQEVASTQKLHNYQIQEVRDKVRNIEESIRDLERSNREIRKDRDRDRQQ